MFYMRLTSLGYYNVKTLKTKTHVICYSKFEIITKIYLGESYLGNKYLIQSIQGQPSTSQSIDSKDGKIVKKNFRRPSGKLIFFSTRIHFEHFILD